MKNRFFLSIVFCILFINYGKTQAQSQIILNANGFDDQTMFYLHDIEKEAIVDSGAILNEQLIFEIDIDEPSQFVIQTAFESMETFEYKFLWVENTVLTIWAEKGQLKKARTEGSVLQQQAEILQASKAHLEASLDSIQQAFMSLNGEGPEKRTSLRVRQEQVMEAMTQKDIDYVKNNPDHLNSVFVLTFTMRNIPKHQTRALFEHLVPELQTTKYGVQVQQYLELSQNIKTGDQAEDFQLPDLEGKTISLSNFKGQYILLEFWSSNCGPCRMENPNLLKNYNLYRDKGFEIISISLDKKRESWQNAVEKDHINWTTVCDLQGYSSKPVIIYNITYIPKNYLINPDGIIIAEDLRGEQLGEKLSEIFQNK